MEVKGVGAKMKEMGCMYILTIRHIRHKHKGGRLCATVICDCDCDATRRDNRSCWRLD